MSYPETSFPNTVCLPSNQGVLTVVMKNYDPLVLGPALAIDNNPGDECLILKFSSGKVLPYIDSPPKNKYYSDLPVPLWLVKSPP